MKKTVGGTFRLLLSFPCPSSPKSVWWCFKQKCFFFLEKEDYSQTIFNWWYIPKLSHLMRIYVSLYGFSLYECPHFERDESFLDDIHSTGKKGRMHHCIFYKKKGQVVNICKRLRQIFTFGMERIEYFMEVPLHKTIKKYCCTFTIAKKSFASKVDK